MDPKMMSKRPFENLSFADLEEILGKIVEARNYALDEDPTLKLTAPRGGWQCFHCGHVFFHEHQARLHFGSTQNAKVQCLLPQDSRELLGVVRDLEQELEAYRNEQLQT